MSRILITADSTFDLPMDLVHGCKVHGTAMLFTPNAVRGRCPVSAVSTHLAGQAAHLLRLEKSMESAPAASTIAAAFPNCPTMSRA